MKKYVYPALSALAGAAIFGIGGFLKFVGYGASDCDMPGKSCECFCCNSFGLRGYEACGDYGFLVGAGVGAVVGLIIYMMAKKINNQKHS